MKAGAGVTEQLKETDQIKWVGLMNNLESARREAYAKLFGTICDSAVVMARCACVACNSCTCACSCRKSPVWEEVEW